MGMSGKTVLVTGATAGIGYETARALAKMDAQVVVVSRYPKKCAQVVDQLRAETANPRIEYLAADLSSLDQVRQLAFSFKKRYPKLDVLVNNAGALFASHSLSSDGIDMTIALNHLNYFQLTHLLMDTLKASAPARIINVASDAHHNATPEFVDRLGKTRRAGFSAYSQSKLANIMFTYELDRRLDGAAVTVNAVHPGFVASNFAKNNGVLYRLGMAIASLFGRSSTKGAETVIYLATSPDVEGVSGKYFFDLKPVKSSSISYDQNLAERLWQASLELVSQ